MGEKKDEDDDDFATAETLFFAIWWCRLFSFAIHGSKLPLSLSFTFIQTSCETRGQQVNGLLLQQQQRRSECWQRTSLFAFSLLFFAPLNPFQLVVGRALPWRR